MSSLADGSPYRMARLCTFRWEPQNPTTHEPTNPTGDAEGILQHRSRWFVATEGTHKLEEIAFDPHVNVSYYKGRTREWVSVSGVATLSRDRQKIR